MRFALAARRPGVRPGSPHSVTPSAALPVGALDDAARRFYLRFGFISLVDDPTHLFLGMHVIRKLGLPPLVGRRQVRDHEEGACS